jgi:hypothetical protein
VVVVGNGGLSTSLTVPTSLLLSPAAACPATPVILEVVDVRIGSRVVVVVGNGNGVRGKG